MGQTLQILGALLILMGYALAQGGVLDPRSYPYLLLNLIGAALLTVLAFAARQGDSFSSKPPGRWCHSGASACDSRVERWHRVADRC